MEIPALWLYGFLSAMTLMLVVQLNFKLGHLQRLVVRLMKHQGIDPTKPAEVSDKVKALARDPARKIQAIKALREETGIGLAEAKRAVEEIAGNSGV